MEDLSELEGMKRAELQRLAKKVGVKANMKTDAIIRALKKHYSGSESLSASATEGTSCSEDGKTEDESAHSAVSASDSVTSSAYEEHLEHETSENTQPKRAVRKGRKGRKKTKAPIKSVAKTPEQKLATPTACSAPKQARGASKGVTPKTDGPTAPAKPTPVPDKMPLRRKTRSVTPKMVGNAPKTKVTPAPVEVPIRRQTRSVTPKNGCGAPVTVTPADAPIRRRTYEMEQELDAGKKVAKERSAVSSDPEMKKAIIAELEQKAEEKLPLQSRIPKHKTAVSKANKPITPGNKDWSRIHQAQFNKMESIDDYVARKRKRTETLCASVKKAKLIADEARAAVQILTSHRTPQGSSAKIAKPVSRIRSGNLPFSSPKPSEAKVPVAKVRTTTAVAPIAKGPVNKSVTFKMSRLKTPTRAAVLLGRDGEPRPKRKSTPGPRKSVSVIETSAKKPLLDLSLRKSMGETIGDKRKSIGAPVTPFKFGQTATTPAPNTSKKAFDLKASLNKPLTYKPHTGKLKPLEVSSRFQATSNIQKAKAKVMKKPTLTTCEDRRAAAKRNQASKRANNLMARRGISEL